MKYLVTRYSFSVRERERERERDKDKISSDSMHEQCENQNTRKLCALLTQMQYRVGNLKIVLRDYFLHEKYGIFS